MSENAATNDPLTVRGLQRLLLGNVVRTGRRFATGAFGSVVEELEMDGLICAGKQLHTPLPSHDGCALAEELSRLFDLRHPNIVQLLGICFLHDTETVEPSCPHIVMEYLPHCLDNLLNHASSTPLSVKHSILCDVAAGLSYLHNRSPPVVHCKLTASNVLLTSGMEAKICDIRVQGVSWQPSCSHTPQTKAMEAYMYMPPEALDENPNYCTSTDMFSFGQLCLYTIIEKFPIATAATCIDPDKPGMIMARTEVDRRLRHIHELSQVAGDNASAVVQLVVQCLQNDPGQRLSARQALRHLKEEWVGLDDPYEQMTKLELIVSAKLLKATFQQQELRVQELESQLKAATEAHSEAQSDHVCNVEEVNDTVSNGQEQASVEQPSPQEEVIGELCNHYGQVPSLEQPSLQVEIVRCPVYPSVAKQSTPVATGASAQDSLSTQEDRAFKCEVCDAAFPECKGLERHVATHTRVKPFGCEICGKPYRWETNLKSHIVRVHTNVYSFHCPVCSRSYTTPSRMKQHFRATGHGPSEA